MKNALICLERLGIGGVETFTITQIEEFSRRNIKCIVLCKDGILREKISNKKNIHWINFDFEIKNEIDYEKVVELENIVKKNKIDFIYVHQFSIIPYILPIVYKMKIPYIAYLHNIVPKTCEWFMDTYDIYKALFPMFLEGASKLIAITNKVKEENMKLFSLPEERYITINNSLDFTNFPDRKIKKIKMEFNNLVLFGRIAEQKRNSIYTAVDFFHYVKEKYNPKAQLTIIGDGEIYEEISKKFQEKDIHFKGAISNMAEELEKADILLGVDRCMLEAVASKKPAIVCGYNKNTVMITPNNLKDAIVENFTGINLADDKDELFSYNEEELKDILEKNYKYVKEKLSITDCVYLDITPFDPTRINLNHILENINYYTKSLTSAKEETKKWYDCAIETHNEVERLNKEIENTRINKFKRNFKNIINKKSSK